MKHYKPKRIRPLRLTAMLVRFIAQLIKYWPLLLIVLVLASPITQHLRMSYRYHDVGGERVMWECRYLGVRGYVRPEMSECSLITFIRHQSLFTTL